MRQSTRSIRRVMPDSPASVPPPPGLATPVPSPCISVCRMEAATGLCEGCRRTLEEIARWSSFSDAEKRAVLRAIARRRAQ
jgi:predicted Fe-S protein YdhL (DUF1289 family)